MKSLLYDVSMGHYGREKAIELRDAAQSSIGASMPAKSLELKHTIQLIQTLNAEIEEIEVEIKKLMEQINSPIISILGIATRMVHMSRESRQAEAPKA